MLEKLKGTFDKGVAAVSVKSESIVESSRVRSSIATKQKSVDAAVAELGRRLYDNWLAGDVKVSELEEECRQIQALEAEVTSLKGRLDKIKEEETQILGTQKKTAAGAVFCSNCGKKLDPEMRFCDSCGTPVKA